MRPLRPARPRGGILVLALLCSSIAVLGLTYWVMTVGARSRYVDTIEDAAHRRLARSHGRSLAFRYVQRRVLPATQGHPFLAGFGEWNHDRQQPAWGGTRLATPWSNSPLASNTGSTGINRLSPGDRAGFGLADTFGQGYDLPLEILDGQQTVRHRWQARSYSPALAGDLLVVHTPDPATSPPATPVALTGSIQVNGRAHFHHAGDPGLSVDRAITFNGYSTRGPALPGRPPTNYPPVYSLAWSAGEPPAQSQSPWSGASPRHGVDPWTGASRVIWDQSDPGAPVFSLRQKIPNTREVSGWYQLDSNNGYSSDGRGTVTINLDSPTLDSVIVTHARLIRVIGQLDETAWLKAPELPTLLVVVRNAPSPSPPEDAPPGADTLAEISFEHKNNRRLVFAVSSQSDPETPVPLRFPQANLPEAGVGPNWRLILTLEQTPVSFDVAGGSLTLRGGLSTDRSLHAPSAPGGLTLERDLGPVGLTTKTPRRAWSEGFRLD